MITIRKCDIKNCNNENAIYHIVIWKKGKSSKKRDRAEVKSKDICEECFNKIFKNETKT